MRVKLRCSSEIFFKRPFLYVLFSAFGIFLALAGGTAVQADTNALFQTPPKIEPIQDQDRRKTPDDVKEDTPSLGEQLAFLDSTSIFTFKEDGWHFIIGLGVGYPIYGESGQQLSDAIQNQSGTHVPARFDADLYWPTALGGKRIQGITLNGLIDNVTERDASSETQFQVGQMLMGYSTLLFLGETLGEGWFLRGDLGLAILNWSQTIKTDNFIVRSQQDASTGLGALLGGGYSWDTFGGGPHTLLTATTSYNRSASSLIGPVSAWVFALNAGILF